MLLSVTTSPSMTSLNPPFPNTKATSNQVGLIAGGTIGGLTVIVLTVCVILFMAIAIRLRRKAKSMLLYLILR